MTLGESRLTTVRHERGDWLDEEHDPEGFILTFEWQQADGARSHHVGELSDLDQAADRVARGSYGLCDSCTNEIPAAQLELRPARTTCVACTDRHR